MAEGRFQVLDRYEQQADTFKIMNIEKAIAYLFLTFILMVACFNIIGSLSMLIIDKKEDAQTLSNMGATGKQISRIFLYEGRMIRPSVPWWASRSDCCSAGSSRPSDW